jgi:hypothetical protein
MALGELKNGIGPDAYAIYQQVLAAVVERDHPVGSLYISENATSPAELYGGTWERIEGKFIMGASDTYPAGSTGGSATHTQTVDEIAPHNHYYNGYNKVGNGTPYLSGGDSAWEQEIPTSDTGGGKPMDILNPYYSMYIWRRVA